MLLCIIVGVFIGYVLLDSNRRTGFTKSMKSIDMSWMKNTPEPPATRQELDRALQNANPIDESRRSHKG